MEGAEGGTAIPKRGWKGKLSPDDHHIELGPIDTILMPRNHLHLTSPPL